MPFGLFKKKPETPSPKPAATEKSGPVQYLNLKVKEVIRETPDAISIVFEQPEGKKINYTPGQFFTLIPVIEGKKVRRAYSVCTSPYTDANPAVTVKRVEGGLVSNFLNDQLKAGDTLEVMEPMGNFTTVPAADKKRHVVLFGGGSGITPLMSIAKSVLAKEPESAVSLIYANRNQESVIFGQAIQELEKKHEGRFQVIHVLDQPPAGWNGYAGMLTPENIPGMLQKLPQWSADNIEYFICGPEGLMSCVEKSLLGMYVPKEQIHKESFVPGKTEKNTEGTAAAGAEVAAGADAGGTYQVTIILDGEEHTYAVEPDKTILETGLDLGIDMPYSCQSGLCTACRGKCISGKVKMDEDEGLSESELEEGYVLCCVGHPATDNVVIEIG